MDNFMVAKIVLVGDSGVGKTCLNKRYLGMEFNSETKSTIGVEFSSKTFQIEENEVKVQIWDTAGQERYSSITKAYFRGAKGAMILYDITKSKSFQNVEKWLNDLKEHSGNEDLCVMMIGNKSDLNDLREVSTDDAKSFAEKNGLYFIETSAKDSSNVESAFTILMEQIVKKNKDPNTLDNEKEKISNNGSFPLSPVDDTKKEKKQGGCCSK